ncbi:MAG: hypothetical protein Q4C23_03695 [Mycoplasmatota bacterium]|nr:hypothetical protein [Mycoplasmatota bacterium]
MYIEILLVGVIVFFLLIYNGSISTSKFFGENKGMFEMLQEKDYEFLLRAKYGERVYDVSQVFRKRVMKGLIAMILVLFIFIANLKILYILLAVIIGYIVFKIQYFDLKKFYKKHLNTIDSLLPYYLKSLEILVQHYTVPVALARSIDDAPEVFKPGLRELVAKIDAGDSTVDPYMDFANQYPVRDSMRMMRLLYRLSLGEQDKKHEQMLSFSKTVSSLQLKAREQKYKARLNTMESQTMKMLVCTGGAALIIMLIASFSMLGA